MTEDIGGFSEITVRDQPAPRDHNLPPAGLTVAGDDLCDAIKQKHGAILKRAADLIAAESRLPAEINSDDEDQKATAYVKQIQACFKELDAARVGEKAPYDLAASQIHSTFRTEMDKLQRPSTSSPFSLKERVEAKQTAYKRRVMEAERAKREEEARKLREEEDRRRREAQEAERVAREAEAAAARKRSEAAKLEAERVAAEARAKAEETRKAELAAAQTRAKAEESAAAPTATMTRARGEHGGISSLAQFWTFRDLDRGKLDLEKLRDHLPVNALEQAVRSYIRAGGRSLAGVTIFEDNTTKTR